MSQAMPQTQKDKYHELANREHQRGRLDSYGVPLRAREEKAKRKVQEKEVMITYIRNLVGGLQNPLGKQCPSFLFSVV